MDDVVGDGSKTARRAAMRRARLAIVDRPQRAAAMWPLVLAECRDCGAKTVMAFVGVGSEPETAALLDLLSADDCTVVLPRVEGGRIVAVGHTPSTALEPGPFGIPVPNGPAVDPRSIDAVIVPGLAFTRDGRRLGQGGGFYDRFVPLLRDDCRTIGVCFREQIVDDLPTEPHDRIVDVVITDPVPE